MITEFKTIPKAVYYVQTADGCTVLDPDGDALAEITAPGGYFPGIAAADGGPGTVTFSAPVKRVVGPFDLAPQLQLTLLGPLGGDGGLPAGFKRVEYLQSDGGQYILTGVRLTSDAQFSFTSQQLKFKRDVSDFQIGARCASANTLFVGPGNYYLNSWQVVGGLNGNYYFIKPPYSNTEKVSIFLNGKQAKINGEIVNAGDKYVLSTDNYDSAAITEAALFGVTRATQNDVLICSACRIWDAEIWSDLNKKNERKFVPALDPTGSPCMFDLVSKKPFYNSGTGDFTYPTATATYSRRRVLPDWGKLTENGLRRLYHAPASYQGELYDYALEHGYKPIVEPEKPEEGYWSPRWTETEEEIVLEWVETEPPTEDYLTQPTE